MSDGFHHIKSYVIRIARMSDAQKRAYKLFSPRWVIAGNKEMMDWDQYFPNAKRHIVEIGFGMGDATRLLAKKHPEWGILGIEVHKPGVGKLLWWIGQEQLKNIFIVERDVVEVFSDMIPSNSVDGVHIWFPDPWLKKRHYKRRLIQLEFVALMTRVLKVGGYVNVATDWEPYAKHILEVFTDTSGLVNRYKDWAHRPDYRPYTKFEHRGINARRVIRDIIFEKGHV